MRGRAILKQGQDEARGGGRITGGGRGRGTIPKHRPGLLLDTLQSDVRKTAMAYGATRIHGGMLLISPDFSLYSGTGTGPTGTDLTFIDKLPHAFREASEPRL